MSQKGHGLCHQTDLYLNTNSTTFSYQHLYFSNYKMHMCLYVVEVIENTESQQEGNKDQP